MASESGIRVQVVIASVGGAESGGTTIDKPLISGQGDPYATVDIYGSATLLGSVTANAEGNGSFQPATPLLDDVHDLSAIQASANGVTSVTNYFALTVEAADAPPAIDSDTSSPSFTSPLTDGEAAHKPPLFPVNHFRSRRCE
jgi:large repetitive protein